MVLPLPCSPCGIAVPRLLPISVGDPCVAQPLPLPDIQRIRPPIRLPLAAAGVVPAVVDMALAVGVVPAVVGVVPAVGVAQVAADAALVAVDMPVAAVEDVKHITHSRVKSTQYPIHINKEELP